MTTDAKLESRILLSEWLPILDAAGVPHIPAVPIGSATVAEWLEAIDGLWPRAVEEAMLEAARSEPGHMVRWDCCASEDLKCYMARPDLASPKLEQRAKAPPTCDDPRLCDILFDCAGIYGMEQQIALYRRPWWQAYMEGGWPVEFRVFYRGGELQGVSSYYPQRPLAEEYEHDANVCAAMAGRIAAQGPRDFSADMLLMENGRQLVVIECGPPHERGAHPCCFRPGEISGIVLSASLK